MRRTSEFAFPALVGSLLVLVLAGGIISAAALGGKAPAGEGDARAADAAIPQVAADPRKAIAVAPPTTDASLAPSTTLSPVTNETTSSPTTVSPPPPPPSEPPPSTPIVRVSRADWGPGDPGGVEVPFSPGSTSWTGVSNGVTISVHTDKATPRVGDPIQFDFEVTSPVDPCCGMWFLFADGSVFAEGNEGTCGARAPVRTPGTARFSTTHIYNLDGRWTFYVQPITDTCETTGVHASLYGTIEIAPGTATAQGPSSPTVLVGRTTPAPGHESDPTWASIVAQARDEDGWLRGLTLDWGDGTPPQAFGDGGLGCRPHSGGWPSPSLIWVVTNEAIHHYAAPATYTITATVESTGCDGSLPQQGAASLAWTVPA
jgi:hypothetical protein